jgi:hypothetical protein
MIFNIIEKVRSKSNSKFLLFPEIHDLQHQLIDFPPKNVPCISFNLPLLGWGPSSEGQGFHL